MSDSNADPEWTILEAAETVREFARKHLGEDVSDDVIFRCLAIIQATMDITLSVASEMEVPLVQQGDLAEKGHDLSHELLTSLFSEIALKMKWQADG